VTGRGEHGDQPGLVQREPLAEPTGGRSRIRTQATARQPAAYRVAADTTCRLIRVAAASGRFTAYEDTGRRPFRARRGQASITQRKPDRRRGFLAEIRRSAAAGQTFCPAASQIRGSAAAAPAVLSSCVEEQRDTSGGHLGVPSVAGRWHLLAWHSVGDDGAITGRPFGEHPHGVAIYTPGGWMAGQLAATSRPAVDGADPLGGPQDQRAAAY
jgi:hypothetical protein